VLTASSASPSAPRHRRPRDHKPLRACQRVSSAPQWTVLMPDRPYRPRSSMRASRSAHSAGTTSTRISRRSGTAVDRPARRAGLGAQRAACAGRCRGRASQGWPGAPGCPRSATPDRARP
jgi:hypothetical protein